MNVIALLHAPVLENPSSSVISPVLVRNWLISMPSSPSDPSTTGNSTCFPSKLIVAVLAMPVFWRKLESTATLNRAADSIPPKRLVSQMRRSYRFKLLLLGGAFESRCRNGAAADHLGHFVEIPRADK